MWEKHIMELIKRVLFVASMVFIVAIVEHQDDVFTKVFAYVFVVFYSVLKIYKFENDINKEAFADYQENLGCVFFEDMNNKCKESKID